MKITLVRHAQVEEAYQGKYNGHNDISLSPEGFEQAKLLGKKLQALEFDKIYCSDLRRTRETLDAFELNLPTTFTPELREKSWGIHEGKSFEEIEATGIKYKNFAQWLDALDGEEYQTYQERIKEYFYEVLAKESVKSTLVVTHAGVIKTLLGILHHLSLEESFALKVEYGDVVVLDE